METPIGNEPRNGGRYEGENSKKNNSRQLLRTAVIAFISAVAGGIIVALL